MKRRRVLAASAGTLSLSIAGCTSHDGTDGTETDDNRSGSEDGTGGRADESPTDEAEADGTEAPDEAPTHARSGAGVPGQIDPRGHVVADTRPFYTDAAITEDGNWGLLGAFPTGTSQTASTLVDLADLDSPAIVHELATSDAGTRTNAVTFDPQREGLYYRSQEGDVEGVEVVDVGWRDGSPANPQVVASLETPNTGVHQFDAHPTEPLLYLVDHDPSAAIGIHVADVSDPAAPEIVGGVGPAGGCHSLTFDGAREVIHAAYAVGPAEGYVSYDAADPASPSVRGQLRYDELPDYTALGEPGFEVCHAAVADPDRDLVIVGDETRTGVPGGKHVVDIGWGEGSLAEPNPIGFTHAPDAREMGTEEAYWWTTHFHDVVTMDGETLLVDGGYRQGVWVCNLTDPTAPTPTERIATVSGASDLDATGDNRIGLDSPPFAWRATYNAARDVVFASDSLTGAYTFRLSIEGARGERGRGPDGHYDRTAVREDDADTVAAGDHGF